ncbi:MAG: 2-dehydro-3-deoxygalactonokinase [Clostridia bacterium]|nr:2-dehydro-3-deoxygalactonokinase [Clostridia bacterium]
MANYITIDGGTTNTRVGLVLDGNLIETVKIPVGAMKSIGGNGALKDGIRQAIESLLAKHGASETDIAKILASGMITCEFGLCNLPHITAPAGISELHDSMHETVIEDISSIPIVFIRGVKTVGSLNETDMMRGEETELMGLLSYAAGDTLFVLPGSHSKLIEMENGKITAFSTMLTGEMIAALSGNTILKDAVDLSVSETDAEFLTEGYRQAEKCGINQALFRVRILKNLFGADSVKTYSFFLGAVLQGEIASILSAKPETVMLGGKQQLRDAMKTLLDAFGTKNVISLTEDEVEKSVFMGQIAVYEYGK